MQLNIRALYEGHYRSLEPEFVRLASGLIGRETAVTVIAAGSGQLTRLRELLLEELAGQVMGGVEFLPGIPHLVQKLSPLPVSVQQVSHADRTFFALSAMEVIRKGEPLYELCGNAETAHSLAGFFEELLDQGVSPSSYSMILDMMEGDTALTVEVVGRIFTVYARLRHERYPFSRSDVTALPFPEGTSGAFLFYGFYDLNPAQRGVLRRLSSQSRTNIYWFSPAREMSPWPAVYKRTRKFLEDLGIASVMRCGGELAMVRFASFFETLPEQPRPSAPMPGFRITAVSGVTGAAREVLDRITCLTRAGIDPSRIAVVSRTGAAGVIRLAHHEGVPVSEALTTAPMDMPYGRLLSALVEMDESGYHYSTVEKIGTTGALRKRYSFEPGEVLETVLDTGIRMGRDRWRDWLVTEAGTSAGLPGFIREVCTFFESLPPTAPAAVYLERLNTLFRGLCNASLKTAFLDQIFDERRFRHRGETGWKRFAQVFRIECRDLSVVLRKGSPDGFRILNPEQVRGSLFHTVILLDMEEGIWPSVPVEDPRLPDEFRKMLELPMKADREQEDGFLLRQVGEAATKGLELVYRSRDSKGSEVYPSPFIAPLVLSEKGYSPSPDWFSQASSSPMDRLLGGSHPGQTAALEAAAGRIPSGLNFLPSILRGEAERLSDKPFGHWDGVVGDAYKLKKSISASLLESYVRCPFVFMAEKVWGARDRVSAGVTGRPDPRLAGTVVHEAVESVIRAEGFAADESQILQELNKAASGRELEALLGSRDLEELWLRRQVRVIRDSLRELSLQEWSFVSAELSLDGTLGSLSINGRIDLVVRDSEGCLTVIDLKTGKARSNRDTTRGWLYQLPFYYTLLRQNMPGEEIAYVRYASISAGEPGALTGFTGSEAEELIPDVIRRSELLAGLIQDGYFPPFPSKRDNCGRCGFKHLCRRSPEERLDRKLSADPRLSVLMEMR